MNLDSEQDVFSCVASSPPQESGATDPLRAEMKSGRLAKYQNKVYKI